MSGYTKLFSSILASTIWREDKDTRIVWITLLAMADKNGIAEGSIPGLADFARLSVDETRKALIKLESPDPDSRTQVDEGRRIRTIEGGWLLVNHAKYRQKLNEDERREYKRLKQAQYRAAGTKPEDDDEDDCGQPLTGVDNGGTLGTMLPNVTQPEASPDPDTKAESKTRTQPQPCPAIATGPHRSHAFCSIACVPSFLHQEFRAGLNRENQDSADDELRQGYRQHIAAWPAGKATGDAIAFWRAWYREKYAPPVPVFGKGKTAGNQQALEQFLEMNRRQANGVE